MFVLSFVGYLLLAVVALVFAAIGLVLFVPARFRASGEFSFRPSAGDEHAAGDDAFWLDLLDLPDGEQPAQPQGELPPVKTAIKARLTWFGGALVVDTGGIAVFGRRIGTARRAAARRPPEEQSTPEATVEPGKAGEPAAPRTGRRAPEGRGRPRGGRGRPRGGRGRRPAGRGLRVDPATVRRLIRPGLRALYRSWSALGLRLRLRFAVGSGDPLATALIAGRVAAVAYPIARSANARRPGSVDFALRSVFSEEVLTAAFDLSGRTTVFSLARPIAGFAWQPEVRKLWWPGRARGTGSSVKRLSKKEAA